MKIWRKIRKKNTKMLERVRNKKRSPEAMKAALRRYQFWRDIISSEDRKRLDASLGAYRRLARNDFRTMASLLKKSIQKELPSIPEEAFRYER